MSARVVLAGGGLANSLIAWMLRSTRPHVDVKIVEGEDALGGNHVWSFHGDDLTPAQREWIEPLVVRSWPDYEVRFPSRRRTLTGGYSAVTSERLHEIVGGALGDAVAYGAHAELVEPSRVTLRDGRNVDGDVVIDGRGDPGSPALTVAFQKFLGQWLELEADHDLDRPILMDATVEQRDGFRFVYTLPFGARLVHVEDTYYADTPGLDDDAIRAGILDYARSQGWTVRSVAREERGVLPIVLGGDIDAFWAEAPPGVVRSGLRAALFHPTTGYSLPEAVRLADAIARSPSLERGELDRFVRDRSKALWKRNGFFRLLNRMLFRAAEPEERYHVLERFYGLPEPLIRRFYAGRATVADRVRILAGRPPVPVRRALMCLRDAS